MAAIDRINSSIQTPARRQSRLAPTPPLPMMAILAIAAGMLLPVLRPRLACADDAPPATQPHDPAQDDPDYQTIRKFVLSMEIGKSMTMKTDFLKELPKHELLIYHWFRDPDPKVQAQALRVAMLCAIGRKWEPDGPLTAAINEAIPNLRQLLGHEDESTRTSAAMMLLRTDKGQAVALEALKDKDPRIVLAVERCMPAGFHHDEMSPQLREILIEVWPPLPRDNAAWKSYRRLCDGCLHDADRKAVYREILRQGGPNVALATRALREDPDTPPSTLGIQLSEEEKPKPTPIEQKKYEQAVATLRAAEVAELRASCGNVNPAFRQDDYSLFRVLNDSDPAMRLKALLAMGSPRGQQMHYFSGRAIDDLETAVPWLVEMTRDKDPVIASLAFDWIAQSPAGFATAAKELTNPDLNACAGAVTALAHRRESMSFTPGEAMLVIPIMVDLMQRPLTETHVVRSRLEVFRSIPRKDQIAIALELMQSDASGAGIGAAASTLSEYRLEHPEINPRFLLAVGRGSHEAAGVVVYDLRPDQDRRVQIPAYFTEALAGKDPVARRGAVLVLAKSQVIPNEPIMQSLLTMRPTDDEWKEAVGVLVRRMPDAEFARWTHDAIFGEKEARRATHRLLEMAAGAMPADSSPDTNSAVSASVAPTTPWLPPASIFPPSSPAGTSAHSLFPLLSTATVAVGGLGFCLLCVFCALRPLRREDRLVLDVESHAGENELEFLP